MPERPEVRRIRVGDQVYEAIGPATPDDSVFLFNRVGRIRRRIELLEHQLAAAQRELAEAEADASQVETPVEMVAATHQEPGT